VAKKWVFQALSLVTVTLLWTAASLMLGEGTLPTPLATARAVLEHFRNGEVLPALGGSLFRTLASFAVAMIAGLAYGISAARSQTFHQYTQGAFTLLLFAPTLVIVFVGLLAMGLGSSVAVILISSLATFPIVGTYVRDVMKDVDRGLMLMAQSFRSTTRQRVADIYLPYLVPPMLACGRVALNSSWKVVLLCEVFGFPGGLGYEIRNNFASYDIPSLLAWVVILVAVLLMSEQLIRLLERFLVRWK
jgi:NitT/TauT family transport system permease protein